MQGLISTVANDDELHHTRERRHKWVRVPYLIFDFFHPTLLEVVLNADTRPDRVLAPAHRWLMPLMVWANIPMPFGNGVAGSLLGPLCVSERSLLGPCVSCFCLGTRFKYCRESVLNTENEERDSYEYLYSYSFFICPETLSQRRVCGEQFQTLSLRATVEIEEH